MTFNVCKGVVKETLDSIYIETIQRTEHHRAATVLAAGQPLWGWTPKTQMLGMEETSEIQAAGCELKLLKLLSHAVISYSGMNTKLAMR